MMEDQTEPKLKEVEEEVPVFEIRTYSFNIKGISEYLKLMSEGFWEARTSFSAVLGPWKSEINSLCEVVYIGCYDSLSHLLATRKQMLDDAKWNQYVLRLSDLQMSFHNVLMVLLPGTQLNTHFQPSESAVYELQTIPEIENRTSKHVEGSTVVGRFLSVYGPSKTEYCLLRYPDPKLAVTDALQHRTTLPSGANTRLMVPTLLSNLK